MDNFYGYEEKRIEKIKPIVETPLELKRKLDKQENKRKGRKEVKRMELFRGT